MKNLLVQGVAFLFIALTPYASVAAFPIYLLMNMVLGPAAIVALLVTSRQVGNRLEFDRTGFAGRFFQVWYWGNVALAVPCIVVVCCFCVFGFQRGDHVVDRRVAIELDDGTGRIDLLIGRSKKADSQKTTRTLLAYILFDPVRSFDKVDFSGGDGLDVSATNVTLNAQRTTSFGYGSIWNRTSDSMAIQDKEFSRRNGNVFVILQANPYAQDIIQLPAICDTTDVNEVIRFAKNQCEALGETRLRSLRLK